MAELDISKPFKAVADCDEKLKTLTEWTKSYFEAFVNSEVGQHWELNITSDNNDLEIMIHPKDPLQHERVQTVVSILEAGDIEVEADILYKEDRDKPKAQRRPEKSESSFDYGCYSAPQAFGKLIQLVRCAYFDSLTQALKEFNDQNMALVSSQESMPRNNR